MKIISKYKDYYDYIVGIYGEDPKFIYDRTEFFSLPYRYCNFVQDFFIGDYFVQGYWDDGKIYFGKELERFIDTTNYIHWSYYKVNKEENYAIKDGSRHHIFCLKQPKKIENSPTYKLNCPVLTTIRFKDEFIKNPILREYNFNRVFSGEEIWLILSEWFSKKRDYE